MENSTRIYNSSGGFEPISNNRVTCLTNGVKGDENSFYYTETKTINENNIILVKTSLYLLKKINGNFVKSHYSNHENLTDSCDHGFIIKVKDKIYFNTFGQSKNTFLEAINPSQTPVEIKSNYSITKIIADSSNNGLIILGTNHLGSSGIEKYNTDTRTFTNVLSPGEYTIVSISVSKTGVITFMGRRAIDNARVLGSILPGSNELKIINQSLKGDVSSIVYLN